MSSDYEIESTWFENAGLLEIQIWHWKLSFKAVVEQGWASPAEALADFIQSINNTETTQPETQGETKMQYTFTKEQLHNIKVQLIGQIALCLDESYTYKRNYLEAILQGYNPQTASPYYRAYFHKALEKLKTIKSIPSAKSYTMSQDEYSKIAFEECLKIKDIDPDLWAWMQSGHQVKVSIFKG